MKINKHIQFACKPGSLLPSSGNKQTIWSLDVICGTYEHVGVTEVDDFSDLHTIADEAPDLVFLGVARTRMIDTSPPAREVWLADFFEAHHIAHTGSSGISMKLGVNKEEAKSVIKRAGLKTASHITITADGLGHEHMLPDSYPLFVKPSNLGSGYGITPESVVHDFTALQRQVGAIQKQFHTSVVVESFLPGREFTVALLKDEHSEEFSVMPLELVADKNANGDRIVSGSIKQADTEMVLEITDSQLKEELCAFALDAFQALAGQDYGRIDIRMDAAGTLHFLEANLQPGLGGGYFMRACWIDQKLPYDDLIRRIVDLGLARASTEQRRTLSARPLPGVA